jgi:glycosyltransferase 2 family protein
MRTHLKTLVVAAVTLALLGWFFRQADLAQVWREIRSADAWALILMVGVTALTYLLRALRWQVLLEPLGPTRLREVFRTTVIGFAANTVLPARIGEFVRPYLLARRERLSVTAAFTTIILERLLDFVTVLVLLGVFVVFFDPGLDHVNRGVYGTVKASGLMGAIAAGGVLAILALNAVRPSLTHRVVDLLLRPFPHRLRDRISGLAYGLLDGLAVTRDPGRLGRAVALSFPLWLSIAAGIWLVTTAFHMTIPYTGSFLIVALLVVGVAVPTPGAVGGFHEAFRVGAAVFYGIPNDRAVGAAIVLHALSFGPVTLLGGLFMVQDGLDLARVRRIGDEARAEAETAAAEPAAGDSSDPAATNGAAGS